MVGINARMLTVLTLTATLLGGCRQDESEVEDSGDLPNAEADSYYSTWVVNDEHGYELLFFVFFEDGTYLHAEIDNDENGEPSGMEWGRISFDSEGVADVEAATFDGNGQAGLTDFVGTTDLKFTVASNTLTLEVVGGEEAGDRLSFTRLESVGAQGSFFTTETENELLAFTFLPGGTYCHFEYDAQPGEEVNGMECSDYTLDADNVLSHSTDDVLVDNNGDTGLTDFIGTTDLKITFSEEAMTAEFTEDGGAPESMSFERLP